ELGIGTWGMGLKEYTPVAVQLSENIIAVAASQIENDNHSIALSSNGTVWTWGSNVSGQLGDGTTTKRTTPVQVESLSGIIDVDAGRKFSVALDDTGLVHTWGDNSAGQVQPADNTDRHAPSTVPGITNVLAIAAGGDHVLALKHDGTVWAWGKNNMGQLGTGDMTTYSTPQQVLGEAESTHLSSIIAIAAGYDHSLALSDDGKIWAWGSADNGRLGNNTSSSHSSRAVRVLNQDLSELSTVIAIDAGYAHSLALKSNGTIWTWGNGQNGELGDDMVTENSKAVQVKNTDNNGFITNIVAIASSGEHNLAVTSNGDLVSWGHNTYGQIGDNTATNRTYPVAVYDLTQMNTRQAIYVSQNTESNQCHLLLTDVKTTMITVTTQALDSSFIDSIEFSSPNNTYTITQAGQILDITFTVTPTAQAGSTELSIIFTDAYGLAKTTAVDLFVLAPPTITSIEDVITNEDTAINTISFTIADADTLVDELTVTGSSSDTTLVPDNNIEINCSTGFCTGTIMPGSDQSGMAIITIAVDDGIATAETSFTMTVIPVNDPPRFNEQEPKIRGGQLHTLLMTTQHRLISWGDNNYGELGNNSVIDAYTPVYVHNLTTIIDMDGGIKDDRMGTHSIAVDTDGLVWTWGKNNNGQLGLGDMADRYSPVEINDFEDVIQVAAGCNFSIALKTGGTVWSWGNGTYTPSEVAGITEVNAIAAGCEHQLALKEDGTVWAWGNNTYGQLGIDSVSTENFPVQVKAPGGIGFLTDIVAIAAGKNHSMALKSNGTVWTWGQNNNGQLGDDSGTQQQLPVQVKNTHGNDG
ncbi:MAG: hypothetical protein OMM_11588, partial [Candidatus Magnetoglobus multicellularis str. Araruama]